MAAVAVVVAAAAGLVQYAAHPGSRAGRGLAVHASAPAASTAPVPGPASPPTWLTSMRLVSQPGSLTAIGRASITDNFLTCVTAEVCYTLGSLSGGAGDIARSADGGATWTSGEPLPPANAQFDNQVEASCPQALTCFLPYGTNLLATSDGFAHFRILPVTLPSGTAAGQVSQVSCPTAQYCVAALQPGSGVVEFLYSDNGGGTWTAGSSPAVGTSDTIGGLRCDSGGACIAAAVAGTADKPLVAALTSADGGRSWTMSRTYAMPSATNFMVSCPDGTNCVVGFETGYLAWITAGAAGQASIRVQAPPNIWTANVSPISDLAILSNLSCPTGSECFAGLGSSQLSASRDGGRTWASVPLDPHLPQVSAGYLSCPVAAGCVALADGDSSSPSSWVVLSDLGSSG